MTGNFENKNLEIKNSNLVQKERKLGKKVNIWNEFFQEAPTSTTEGPLVKRGPLSTEKGGKNRTKHLPNQIQKQTKI